MTASDNQYLVSLIDRIADNEQSAMADFYDRTIDFAHSIAKAIVVNRADAEEIVLDAYTQVWRTAGSYSVKRGRPLAWLAVVVRSRALDRLRQQRKIATGTQEQADPGPEPDDLIHLIDTRTDVHAALNSLTMPQRQVLGLAYLRDHSHTEIAKILDLPLGTVKSHAKRALSAMHLSLTAGRQQ